jgi:type 2 lantibiotic biosynthesis protein LanM
MYCVRTPSVVEEGAGAPSVGGLPARPEEHLDALCSGFERTYRFLRTVRADLDREGGPLAGLAACRTRVLLRATGVYYGVLDRALEPAALRSGVLRAIELDALARALLLGEPVLGGGAILDAEREALWRGDVPTFWVQCDRRELRSEADRDLDGRYSVSGLAAVRQRLDGMSEQDLEEQLELIRGAVHARLALPSDRAAGGGAPLPGPRPGRRQRSASFEHVALRCARAIAARLEESALRSPEGAGWIGLVFLAGARRYQLVPLGPSLYDGNAGIALFLSALAAVDRDDAMAAFARAALSPLCHPTRDGSALGIGGLAGLGSVVYAQSRVALLLDDPSLLHDAQRSAAAITEGAIAGDRELDLVSGVAGAMLGLLALAETSADEMVRRDTLERARLCGEHLLARHLSCEGRSPAWLGDGEDVPLTGFSHGAAGIAYSLARLYGVSGGPALREAALGGIRYERETFDAEAGNWPDLRRDASGAKRGFGCSWCHGAPGIGLARLGTLGALTNGDSGANGNGGADGETTARERRELCEEIEVALRSICSTDLIDVDTVCCGNFGRLETLLVASLRLSRPHLLEEARAQARAALERAEGEGGFRLFANLPRQVSSPGFFQGIAGIGYQLLRLAFPERLPSVLSLE